MNVSATSSPGAPQKSQIEPQKILQAAQEFEAMLLQSFLRPLTESFSTLPSGDSGMGMSGYQDLGLQALASGMAKAGGLGLADMIVRNLMHLRSPMQQVRPLGQGVPMELKLFSDPPIVTVSAAQTLTADGKAINRRLEVFNRLPMVELQG